MSNFIVNSQLLRWDNVFEGTGILFDRFGGLGKNVSISVDTNVIATVASLEAYQQVSAKDAAGGYAGLDASGKLATAQINFDTSTFYIDANGILKLKTDRISNPFTATGLGADGVPTGLTLGEDAATLADVEINDTIRFSTAISWSGTDYEAQTVFMRVATTAGTLADFAVQGAPVTSLDQLEQGAVNKYLTPEQLEKLIRMNYSDIAYTGQLSSTADDCDGYLTSGVWNVPNAAAILNTPVNGQGGILFCFQRGSYSNSARVQVYLQSAGAANPVIPYIRVYNGTAATWSAWERIIKSTDLATTAANGLMSAADKAKIDGLGTQTQLDGKYVKKTGDTMTGNLVFQPGKGVNGSLLGVYPSTVSATNLDGLLKANTTFSYTFYYFPNTFALTPALIAKNVVLADNSNTMQTWNSGSGEGYQRAIIYPSSSNPLLKFYGDVWKEYLFREDLASPTKAGVMSAADKAKLDNTLPQSDSDLRYIRNGFSGERKMCLSTNQDVPAEGELNYIAACGYGSSNTAICHGLTVARRPNGSYAVYLQTFGVNSTLEICSKGAATILGYSAKTLQTAIYGNSVTVSCNTFTVNGIDVATIADLASSDYLATTTVNGLMSAADKAKLDNIDGFSADFDFALAPTQGQLILVLKNAPAVPPWNFHAEIEVQQFSGAPADRSEPARYIAEGHFAVGEYDLLVTEFPITAANGRYRDSGGRVWTHSTASQYTIKYTGGRWRIYDGTTILYSTHSDDGNPYGGVGSTDGSWVWCTGDTMSYLTGPKVVADTATAGAASWRSVNYNATSISNFLYAGKYTNGGVTYPALFLAGKFTQGKVIVRHLDYNATATSAELELVASTTAVGTIQSDAAKRWDAIPGNIEWDALTAQLIQATNRGDGVRRSYCAALTLGALAYSGSFGWSATSCTIEAPTVSLDLQNTPTDFAVDVAVEEAAAGKVFELVLTNGIQGTHCVVSFRNVSTYRIGMTDGNGKTVYLDGGETALARLVSVNAANRFEWIASEAGNGSGGGTEYVSFTSADVDANGNLVIIAAGEPVAICKTDLSNRVDLGTTAQESAAAGLLKSTINVGGLVLGTGTWYAICK